MKDFVEDCDYEVVLAQPVDYKDHKKCHLHQQNNIKIESCWEESGYRNPLPKPAYVLLNLWLMCNETLYLKFIGLV